MRDGQQQKKPTNGREGNFSSVLLGVFTETSQKFAKNCTVLYNNKIVKKLSSLLQKVLTD
jgi:hypothetical protein